MADAEVKQRPTGKDKRERAFATYLDLLDAAEYIKMRVYDQLSMYGLTMRGFRVLELLHRQGPTTAVMVARACQVNRQNLDAIVKGLAEEGWVEAKRLSVAEIEALGVKVPEGDGRPLTLLRLTEEGSVFAERFLPRHAKVVRAYMRALDMREQRKLSLLCRKLREGDVMRFISEMEHEDVEEPE